MGGYSPINKVRIIEEPIENNTSDQILVRKTDGNPLTETGNVDVMSKEAFISGLPFIPLAGTPFGNPITGPLKFSGYVGNGISYESPIDPNYTSSLFMEDGNFQFKTTNSINGYVSYLGWGDYTNKIDLGGTDPDFEGIVGGSLYDINSNPFAYTQRGHVTDLIDDVDLQATTDNGNTTDNRVFFSDGTVDLSSIDTTTSPSILTTSPKVLIARTVSPTASVSEHGYGDNSKWSPTVADLAYNSFDALPQIEGSTDINHYSGYQSRPTYKNTGEVQLLQGFTSYPRVEAGNVRYSYGFRARGIQTGGNIERNYGLWVDALPSGSIETYSVLTAGSTPSKFGGIVTTGGLNAPANSITLTGSSASYFINGLGTPTLINATIRNQTLGTLPAGSLTRITASSTVLSAFSDLDIQVTDRVRLTTSQTVAGVKTFSSSPIVPTATTTGQAVPFDQMNTALALKANDTDVVRLSGAQTISDVKTFTSVPLITSASTNPQAAVNYGTLQNFGYTVNLTASALTKSNLNSFHPSESVGFRCICPNIISGPIIYTKVTESGSSDDWLVTSATIVA